MVQHFPYIARDFTFITITPRSSSDSVFTWPIWKMPPCAALLHCLYIPTPQELFRCVEEEAE